MSDSELTPTPETDAWDATSLGASYGCVPIYFAQRLERERDEARAKPDWARNGWEAKLVAAGDETLREVASEMVEERRREYGE